MKKNKNPERLRELKKDWWWRRLIFTKFIEPTPAKRKPSKPYSTQARKGLSEMRLFHYHQWKGGIERICYTYELYRRTADVPEAILPFLMPFHRLNDRSLEFFVKSKIDTYLTKQSHLGVFFNDNSINEMSDSFPAGMFWLRQRKDKLLSQFWKEIEKQRKIKKLFNDLISQKVREIDGIERKVNIDDILIVTPFNVQVNYLQSILPEGARVGTIDKFQGQEALIVLISMVSSSAEDMPRNIDFLFR